MCDEKWVETRAWRKHFEGWVRHLEGKIDRLAERLDYVGARMDVLASAMDRIDTEVFLLGCHENSDCCGWEYEDWTFGDLEPGDWFEHDGVEWKKMECHYWANARCGDVVDRFFDDEVVYPFEWED